MAEVNESLRGMDTRGQFEAAVESLPHFETAPGHCICHSSPYVDPPRMELHKQYEELKQK